MIKDLLAVSQALKLGSLAHMNAPLSLFAVFAGDAATGLDAEFENLAADFFGKLKLAGLVGIE